VQSTTTILPGLPADVQISGTSPSQELNFWIPAGQKGDPGISGAPHIGPDEPTDPQVTEWYDTDEESPRGVRVDGDTMLGPLHLVAGSTAAQPPPGDDSTLVATTAFVHDTVTGDVDLSGLIPKSLVDAKGDLIVATAADTVARLPVGATTGHVLTVDPAEAAGVKWAAAAGGGAADGSHRWWTSYAAGAYASPSVVAGNFATVAATTGYIYWCPFFCVATTTFDRMRIYTNQVASGLVRLGIYDATGTGGRAGARILDAGTIATDGAAGDKDLTISQSLTGSTWYWLALTVNRTITVSAFPHTIMAAMPVANLSPGGGAQFASVYSDFTYGALPATAPASVPGLVNAGIVLRAA
jgi:hypothetical protein